MPCTVKLGLPTANAIVHSARCGGMLGVERPSQGDGTAGRVPL